MKGERRHIFEKDPIPGGACDWKLRVKNIWRKV